ncbi:MAG TPA: glucose-1-phosphate cytidylyltransferase [Candidatus Acidoferrum sp.]|nr:glucose-1-phosphate cytidylyltransferase [Candidatus Acidoferrum sp.]
MKVVLFCGGLGMRMREYSEAVPKPMVPIGYRPILWHVMKYYAHYGHKDFILCLGYKANVIKQYFLNYDECVSNDFVYSQGGKKLELLAHDIQDWNITFADTGLHANIGQRLRAVRKYVAKEEVFLANYTDGLSDLPLAEVVQDFQKRNMVAGFVGVKPNATFHLVELDGDGVVKGIRHVAESNQRINGGFFAFRQEIFDHIKDGEELVHEPFRRLIAAGRLMAYPHNGFWACMDTVKEVQQLEELYSQGKAPWEVWKAQ